MVAQIETSSPPERVLLLERIFDAPAQLVFAASATPEHLARWWGPTNYTLPFCEVDFRVGGAYRFCMRSPEGKDYWLGGTYREIAEPSRIVFTWTREDAAGKPWAETVVTVTFEEHAGKTKLTLRQGVFETEKVCNEHQGGWTQCLERLGAYVATA